MLSPVVLFVYNRPSHARQTLESLSKNVLANQSKLYIFSDGPKENENDFEKVQEVRKTIREKKWCREVEIIEREKNLGLPKSVMKGVTQVVMMYKKVIVLEDDIVTSPGFLKYMNDGLDLYINDEKVFGCSGNVEAINKNGLAKTFFRKKGSSWGWATWSRVWQGFANSPKEILVTLFSEKQKKEFNIGGYPFYEMLLNNDPKKNALWAWDIYFYAFSFLNNGLWLTPSRSLTKNIGFDGSGIHTSEGKIIYSKDTIDFIEVNKIPISENIEMKTKIEDFYNRHYSKKVFYRFRRLIDL